MAGGDGRPRRLLAIGAVAVAAVAVAVFALTRDDGPSAQLRALQDDPMGTYVPQGGRLLRTHARNERSTGTFNKQTPATYTRVFELPRATAEQSQRKAVEDARAAGWQLELVSGGLGATGDKRLPTGRGVLTILLSPEGSPVSGSGDAPVMTIDLEHGTE